MRTTFAAAQASEHKTSNHLLMADSRECLQKAKASPKKRGKEEYTSPRLFGSF